MSREFPHTVRLWPIEQTPDGSGGYTEGRGTKRYDGDADVQDARATLGEAISVIAGGDEGLNARADVTVYLPDGETIASVGVQPGDDFEWVDEGKSGRVTGVNRTEVSFDASLD